MPTRLPLLATLAAAALLAPLAARAADKPLLAVTNTQAERVAYCTLLVDGRARTKLAIRPGKTWSDAFDPRRELILVCDRSTSLKFGPLKAGQSYRIVEAPGAKIGIAEGGG